MESDSEYYRSELMLAHLKELCGDDRDSLTEMVTIIRSDLREALDVLPDFIAKKDFGNQAEVIHKLLSKVSILGLKDEWHLLLGFEKILRGNNQLSESEEERLYNILNSALSSIDRAKL